MRYSIIFLLSITLLIGQSGCALTKYYTLPPIPPEEARDQFVTIGIVPARFIPESNFNTFAKGRLSGTGKGAAGGAAAGALGGAGMALGLGAAGLGPAGVLLLPFFAAGGAVIGGVTGGVAGTVKAVPEAKAEEIETAINNALAELRIQETMTEHIVKSGKEITTFHFNLLEGQGPASHKEKINYSFLKEKGIDTVFEVSVKSIGFEGGKGEDPLIALFMTVSTRLIRVKDGTEIYSGAFEYKSKARKFTTWADDSARLLREEFERCYKDLATRIVEEPFLLLDFPLSYWSTHQFCMLRPLYPEVEFGFLKTDMTYVRIDSLQPVLKWESFPRGIDKEAGKDGLLSRITDVSYDLKIMKVEDDFPVELVYARQRLSDPYQMVEIPLEPSTKFFWTVRARFKLDGQERVTRWSFSRRPWIQRVGPGPYGEWFPVDPCGLSNYIPNPNYFRFITP